MKYIEFSADLKRSENEQIPKDLSVHQLFDGDSRKLVEVRMRNSAVLSRHRAPVPITVYCISGSGTFFAGPDLTEQRRLVPGTLLTLASSVEHEVAAEPELHLLVSKFGGSEKLP